ncbi:glycosyltransferase family 25 protein [Rostrohypoxylon terebratum]|nr:glycosyltransferase family 25 protein [Rostrohypoxylon terebratum]
MPPYRRAFAAACVFAPLFYIYWCRLTKSDLFSDFEDRSLNEDVSNSTLGFSKIFVINLPSRTDRRDAMALAGAVGNLTFSWVDGVFGDQVGDLDAPPGNRIRSSGARGSWRSHMNALKAVVDNNLGSALIVEDDIDWDVRLKSQLQVFASASRTWLKESNSAKDTVKLDTSRDAIGRGHEAIYGDDWDVLWLGHCGTDFPPNNSGVSPLRVTILGDDTVPAPKHLKPHPFALKDKLGELYPPHTRVIHASSGTICSLAYAVSYQGARKLLREFDSHYDTQWDLVLQKWCEGGCNPGNKFKLKSEPETDDEVTPQHQEARPVCITVQPPLFSHHYAKGGASNIQGQGGGYAKGTGTPYIRLSVRENMKRLIAGAPASKMVDQLPDYENPIWR